MEFDALKDLISVITRNKVKQIEVLGNPGQEENRTEQLYDGISKGKFASDDDAAKFFFKTDAKDPNYKKLRNRLVRQLINTSFFVDVNQPMFNERYKAKYNCYRDFAAAYILTMRDASKAAVYLMELVLEQTIKFEFTELTAEIAHFLRTRYASTLGDRSNHDHFTILHKQYEIKRQSELKALDYYEDLINYYITKRSPNKDVHELASRYFDELRPLAEEVDTTQFYFHTFQIGIIKHLAINDCLGTIKICDEALTVLQGRKNPLTSGEFATALQKLNCITQLHLFEDNTGDETAQYCLKLASPGSFNWFKIQEAYFYYKLYCRDYAGALNIYSQTMEHQERFDVMGDNIRDIWQMYRGYLHVLAILGELSPDEVNAVAGPAKIARFLNEFMILDKDKEGMNIPRLFLPVLYALANGEVYGEADYQQSVEALDKYRKRYLDNEINNRSDCFMQMLMALSKFEFDADSARRKIKKEIKLLQAVPPQMANQSFAVEIIPYEDLWEMLLKKMSIKID
jgi:hypothetical protein